MSVKEMQKKLNEMPEDGRYELDALIEIMDVIVVSKRVFTVDIQGRIIELKTVRPQYLKKVGDL